MPVLSKLLWWRCWSCWCWSTGIRRAVNEGIVFGDRPYRRLSLLKASVDLGNQHSQNEGLQSRTCQWPLLLSCQRLKCDTKHRRLSFPLLRPVEGTRGPLASRHPLLKNSVIALASVCHIFWCFKATNTGRQHLRERRKDVSKSIFIKETIRIYHNYIQ